MSQFIYAMCIGLCCVVFQQCAFTESSQSTKSATAGEALPYWRFKGMVKDWLLVQYDKHCVLPSAEKPEGACKTESEFTEQLRNKGPELETLLDIITKFWLDDTLLSAASYTVDSWLDKAEGLGQTWKSRSETALMKTAIAWVVTRPQTTNGDLQKLVYVQFNLLDRATWTNACAPGNRAAFNQLWQDVTGLNQSQGDEAYVLFEALQASYVNFREDLNWAVSLLPPLPSNYTDLSARLAGETNLLNIWDENGNAVDQDQLDELGQHCVEAIETAQKQFEEDTGLMNTWLEGERGVVFICAASTNGPIYHAPTYGSIVPQLCFPNGDMQGPLAVEDTISNEQNQIFKLDNVLKSHVMIINVGSENVFAHALDGAIFYGHGGGWTAPLEPVGDRLVARIPPLTQWSSRSEQGHYRFPHVLAGVTRQQHLLWQAMQVGAPAAQTEALILNGVFKIGFSLNKDTGPDQVKSRYRVVLREGYTNRWATMGGRRGFFGAL